MAKRECPDCGGSGADNEASKRSGQVVKCRRCGGTGWVY
jgi:DnaJ-class molecular chaperone